MKVIIFVLVASSFLSTGYGARILVLSPMASRSHYILGSGLAKGLAEAGHDVTIISAYFAENIPKFPNNGTYREIVVESIVQKEKENQKNRNMFDRVDANVYFSLPIISKSVIALSELVMTDPQVRQLLDSAETFDVVIVEEFFNTFHKLFASHFKAPLIVFSIVGANSWVNGLVGNPSPPSYVPDLMLNYSTNMTFFERLHNSFTALFHELFFHFYQLPKHKELAKKYFPQASNLKEVLYNPSIILLNSHISTNVPVPKVPNMIDIGGFHIQPPKKLPTDLQMFLDDAPDGVIYFSMGSHLKSAQISLEKRNAILKSFSKLKQKILWKFEEEISHLPANVMIRKWFPQSDILAHENVKLFITHGGLLSATETIYHGVPILSIPVFGDQHMNAQNAVNNGFGLLLSYNDITEENFTKKLKEILNNSRYRDNVHQRSRFFHDRIVPPMKEAVYWVEYVIRNPNTTHLRVAGVDLPWYKYFLLDILGFMILVGVTIFYIFIKFVKIIVSKYNRNGVKIKQH